MHPSYFFPPMKCTPNKEALNLSKVKLFRLLIKKYALGRITLPRIRWSSRPKQSRTQTSTDTSGPRSRSKPTNQPAHSPCRLVASLSPSHLDSSTHRLPELCCPSCPPSHADAHPPTPAPDEHVAVHGQADPRPRRLRLALPAGRRRERGRGAPRSDGPRPAGGERGPPPPPPPPQLQRRRRRRHAQLRLPAHPHHRGRPRPRRSAGLVLGVPRFQLQGRLRLLPLQPQGTFCLVRGIARSI
jgi:hypothetical protein